ncbi:MAG: GNAT family N-acetyltransferase [Bacillota bacterium]
MVGILRPLKAQDLDKALTLFMHQYEEERMQVVSLPPFEEIQSFVKTGIRKLIELDLGISFIENDKITGYLVPVYIDRFWGASDGSLIPLFGHAAKKENRKHIYQTLYKALSQTWVNQNKLSHAIKLHAHDKDTIDTWFNLGFGNRCIDAIKHLEDKATVNKSLVIKKVSKEDVSDVVNIKEAFSKHFHHAPLFMRGNDEDESAIRKDFIDFVTKENHHYWLAYKEDKAVGLIKAQPTGETQISKHTSMMNVSGLYVLDDYRKQAIAHDLLRTCEQYFINKGYIYLGVDYESFNLSGKDFWDKYFMPYTCTLARRIDEI